MPPIPGPIPPAGGIPPGTGPGMVTETFRTACEGGMSIRAVLDTITKAVSDFEQEQSDDQTLVVIRQTDDAE